MTNPTVGELIEYVLVNRRGWAFKNYDEQMIASGILTAMKEGTLLYAQEPCGRICGIAVFEEQPDNVMFFHDMLVTSDWVLKSFVNIFKERWSEYTVQALRRGNRIMTLDINRLTKQ